MGQSEPPSLPRRVNSATFLIGRDGQGHWVVRDPSGRRGGLFVNRAEALRFALFENGRRPQAVVMVPGVLELDLDRPSAAPADLSVDRAPHRQAA